MGYRHYFYKIPIAIVKDVYDKTEKELIQKYVLNEDDTSEKNKYLRMEDLKMEEVYEFGKLYFDNTAQTIYNTGTPLFNDKTIWEDYYPYVVGKDGILKAIDLYTRKVATYYLSLLTEDEEDELHFGRVRTPYEKLVNHVKSQLADIDKNYLRKSWLEDLKRENRLEKLDKETIKNIEEAPFEPCLIDTNLNHNYLTSSWKYEYGLFNLAFLLKTIDWEKDTIVFLGY